MTALRPLLFLGFASLLGAQASVEARPALRVVPIDGSPYERGLAHGTALRDEIHGLLARWAKETQAQFGLDLATFVQRFRAGTRFEAAARRWTPELLDEVRGIAAGAGHDYETMFVWQCIDEIWAQAGEVVRDKCTVIGVDRIGNRPAFVAQNLDLPEWYHGFQTVLHLRDHSRALESFVVTLPGCVGAAGMSSARVAIGPNTLLQLRPCRDGLPVAFVIRGVLMQPDHAAALQFLQQVTHASGQNYTVGGPDTAPGFECSAGKKVRYEPHPGAPFTFHTNHPLANDDFAPSYRERLGKRGAQPTPGMERCPRFQACGALLTADARPDVETVRKLLAQTDGSPSICNASTYACFVMVLGERPELSIAPGRPDRTPFQVLRF